jgi:hypothetical protein
VIISAWSLQRRTALSITRRVSNTVCDMVLLYAIKPARWSGSAARYRERTFLAG